MARSSRHLTERLQGGSALQAYRAELPHGEISSSAADGATIIVATLLRQAAGLPEGKQRKKLVAAALKNARQSLGAAALRRGCSHDDGPARTPSQVMRLLAERTENDGMLKLAQHLLESAAVFDVGPVERGEIDLDIARNARKQGDTDLAQARFRRLLAHAKRLKSPALQARASIGIGACAQVNGNFVLMRSSGLAALRAARQSGQRRLTAAAHMGLGMAAAISSDHANAVTHLWEAHQLADARGSQSQDVANALAQVFLLAGHAEEARNLFASLLAEPLPLRIALPTVGGYAIASAVLGDARAVDWTSRQLAKLLRRPSFPRECADALIETAIALEMTGRPSRGAALRKRAESLALKHGFHDLTFAEAMSAAKVPPNVPKRFAGQAARVAAQVRQLEPEVLSEVDAILV